LLLSFFVLGAPGKKQKQVPMLRPGLCPEEVALPAPLATYQKTVSQTEFNAYWRWYHNRLHDMQLFPGIMSAIAL
jgi:hypothetical protein